MDLNNTITTRLGLRSEQVRAAVELLDSGNTIPFIARYRKEATGVLDEEQLRQVEALLGRLRALEERRAAVLDSIEEQGKLDGDLRQRILAADTLTTVEDLYAPYRPKRTTRASIARAKGLAPLAERLLAQGRGGAGPEGEAAGFLNEQVESVEQALQGARDIAAETISEHAELRADLRARAGQWGSALAEKIDGADDPRRVYETYYQFELRLNRLRPHQVLALNRGERENVLKVRAVIPERDWQNAVGTYFRPDARSPWAEQLRIAIEDAVERLLLPAVERDLRRALTETAEAHAIQVFASNLRALLSAPPLAGQTVLGLDPGFRTGCKLAVVGPTGRVLATGTIYPHEPQKRKSEALAEMEALVDRHAVTLVAIGNGTASRESEQLAAELIRRRPALRYLIASEAGASVYSASLLARAELPDLDVSLRGAVSIARRVQDPLAELVKIEPKAIGIGLYQHDVDQKALAESLQGVVEDVVNRVGVDLNTASPALLSYVAGIGQRLAERIVAYRDEQGKFTSRAELRKVSGLGPKAFEQSAGFLRVSGGKNPLDASAIHPESYAAAEKLLKLAGSTPEDTPAARGAAVDALRKKRPLGELAAALGAGELTLADIIEQLARPGRDPRSEAPPPLLRADVLKMEDLAAGMRLKGTVRNVVDFGAFVDIGVKQDGLLHRSQVPRGETLQVGDVRDVVVLSVDLERGRVSLGLGE